MQAPSTKSWLENMTGLQHDGPLCLVAKTDSDVRLSCSCLGYGEMFRYAGD